MTILSLKELLSIDLRKRGVLEEIGGTVALVNLIDAPYLMKGGEELEEAPCSPKS